MKTIRTEKYQTSDGKTFTKMEAAKAHEIELQLKSKLPKGKKLTVPTLIGLLAETPSDVIRLLEGYAGSEGETESKE